MFHTGILHSTRYTYTPLPLDEDLDKRYAVPFVMPLVGAALLVRSLDVARSHASSLSRKINHPVTTMAGIGHDKRCCCRKNRLNCTGAASACQGTAQTPRRLAKTSLTQTTIQMMNDVWNIIVLKLDSPNLMCHF